MDLLREVAIQPDRAVIIVTHDNGLSTSPTGSSRSRTAGWSAIAVPKRRSPCSRSSSTDAPHSYAPPHPALRRIVHVAARDRGGRLHPAGPPSDHAGQDPAHPSPGAGGADGLRRGRDRASSELIEVGAQSRASLPGSTYRRASGVEGAIALHHRRPGRSGAAGERTASVQLARERVDSAAGTMLRRSGSTGSMPMSAIPGRSRSSR